MNKNIIISIGIVILLGLGLWWITSNTKPSDSITTTPTVSVSVSPLVSPTATPVSSPAITITSPKAGASVDSPILVTGTARVFENQLTVQVKDSSGKIVAQAPVTTNAKDAGLYGNYSVRVLIPAGTATAKMTVEALAYSAKGDGSLAGDAKVPVTLKYTDIMTVYSAFTTSGDCTTTTLYPRLITKTSQFVLSSILELLQGPLPPEVAKGVTTAIPDFVAVNSLQQNGGTAVIDFNGAIDQGLTAGSCKAQSITAQITNTLKQFLGISTVGINVNGRNDGILQP